MEKLLNIQEQQFYQASLVEFLEFCSQNKCALIIDEANANELLKMGIESIKNQVNQIIFISDNVGKVLPPFIGSEVFIMAADSLEQAVKFAMHSNALSKNVVGVLNDGEDLSSVLQLNES